MSKTTFNQIIKALNIFEVEGNVKLNQMDDIIEVIVNDEYFGLWDCNKNTFVD